MDNVVLGSWIQGVGSVIANLVTGSAAAWIGKRWLNQEKLQKRIAELESDIEFLIEVEKQYIREVRNLEEVPGKNIIREQVRKNGYSWSGKNVSSGLGKTR